METEATAAGVLTARIQSGGLDNAPIWSDVATFDGERWRGAVDIVHGGFPCQDISNAGKRAGIDGERSGLWHHMARIIGEGKPAFVVVENVAALTRRGLDQVLGDLAALGFDAEWSTLRASDVGAPHRRERLFLAAWDVSDPDRDTIRQLAEWAGIGAREAEQRNAEPGHLGERELADTDRQGRTGSEPVAPSGVLPAWPPGPDDHEGWRRALDIDPTLAPAILRAKP